MFAIFFHETFEMCRYKRKGTFFISEIDIVFADFRNKALVHISQSRKKYLKNFMYIIWFKFWNLYLKNNNFEVSNL